MIKTTILTGTEQEVTFAGTHTTYWVQNLGSGDILVGLEPELADGKDDVLIVPSGGTGYVRRDAGAKTVYLSGTGKAQVYGTNNAFCPFKAVSKGGGEVTSEDGTITTGTVDYPIVSLNLYGKSVQDGTPTPENPVDIVSIGDDGVVNIVSHGKNIFDFETWKSGISTIVNGTVEYFGGGFKLTATAADCFTAPAKDANYNIPVEPNTTYTLGWISDNQNQGITYVFLNGKIETELITSNNVWPSKRLTFTTKSDTTFIRVRFGVSHAGNSITYSNIQLEKGDVKTTYEPYKSTKATITSGLPLCSVGDVRDELIYNADGTRRSIKCTGVEVFDGSSDEGWKLENNNRIVTTILANSAKPTTSTETAMVLCDKCVAVKADETWSGVEGISFDKGARMHICITSLVGNSDLTAWTSWLAENPVTVIYQLANPIEINLSAAEMAELMQLQTFDGITYIYNDEGAEMTVKVATNPLLAEYVKPVIDGITARYEARIAALEAAVTNT